MRVAWCAWLLLAGCPAAAPVGRVLGSAELRGAFGRFDFHPRTCRRSAAEAGVGLYDPAAPALALGVFAEPDGGYRLEASGPGATGATRFYLAGCQVLQVELRGERPGSKALSGRVQFDCQNDGPALNHIAGELTFDGCR